MTNPRLDCSSMFFRHNAGSITTLIQVGYRLLNRLILLCYVKFYFDRKWGANALLSFDDDPI